jgi:DNA-binding response OmpR family regulator
MAVQTKSGRQATPRILLVDDEEAILFALREYFVPLGYEIDCARELEEAEALLCHVRYDLLIADLRLSGIYSNEGLELIRFARERSPATRVVVLTGYGSSEMETESMSRGVDAFLHKPRPLAELAEIVSALTKPGP